MIENLRQEIADLKGVLKATAARWQRIDALAWPKGMRIAVNFTATSTPCCCGAHNEPPIAARQGEFGGRVGIWPIDRAVRLARHQGRLSLQWDVFASSIASAEGGRQKRTRAADHMWETPRAEEAAIERDHLRKTASRTREVQRPRPVGSRAITRPSCCAMKAISTILTELPITGPITGGRQRQPYLLELPFHFATTMRCSQLRLVCECEHEQRLSDTDRVFDMWWAGFLQQYRQGGYLNIACIRSCRARLAHCHAGPSHRSHEDAAGRVVCDCEDVARHCLDKHPASARLGE